MRDVNQLLPPASSDFEHRVTLTAAQNVALDAPIDTLSQPEIAPDEFLSFLAWQYSVDSWDVTWAPSTQRALIADSVATHEIKGTIAALRRILDKFGYQMRIIEWWQTAPPLPAGSFKLELETAGIALDESTYRELNRLIADAKPVSRHLTNLSITLTPHAPVYLAAGLHIGEHISLLPKDVL